MSPNADGRGPRGGGIGRRADPGRPAPEEVELKFFVLDAVAIRSVILDPEVSLPGVVPIGPARTVDLLDRYLDTARGALRTAGLVARLRTGTGPRRLTVKSLARRGEGAIHRRLELEGEAGEAGAAGDDPRDWPPSAARERLLDVTGAGALATLVTLQQRRLQRDVAVGTSVVELSLDEVEVPRPSGGPERWVELECELRSGNEADLATLGVLLAGWSDLVPATSSKLERAFIAAGTAFTER